MWSQVTWGSSCLTVHPPSRRTGRASSRTSRGSSCPGWVPHTDAVTPSSHQLLVSAAQQQLRCLLLPPDGSLAEPSHARLLPQSNLVAVHARGHVGWCHQLCWIHLGKKKLHISSLKEAQQTWWSFSDRPPAQRAQSWRWMWWTGCVKLWVSPPSSCTTTLTAEVEASCRCVAPSSVHV